VAANDASSLAECRTIPIVAGSLLVGSSPGNLMLDFLREFWCFLRVRKRFWLLPICVILGLFAGLVVFTQSSVIAPFIYVLF
jgi:hypothetical protein